MATPAERKALVFVSLVATLGAGVQLWRARHVGQSTEVSAERSADLAGSDAADAGAPSGERATRTARSSAKPAQRRGRRAAGSSVNGSRNNQRFRDSTSTVDLDRATLSDIDALGVLPPGTARLIVADRDSFGPFGSLRELKRIPFLSTAAIRKLAPRVTFSRLPRPKNTVIQPRPIDTAVTGRRRSRRARKQ